MGSGLVTAGTVHQLGLTFVRDVDTGTLTGSLSIDNTPKGSGQVTSSAVIARLQLREQ
jgi:hypothetical protein